jgi:hypothetical protein
MSQGKRRDTRHWSVVVPGAQAPASMTVLCPAGGMDPDAAFVGQRAKEGSGVQMIVITHDERASIDATTTLGDCTSSAAYLISTNAHKRLSSASYAPWRP